MSQSAEERASLSAWSERRPRRDETARALMANRMTAHLPQPAATVRVSDADLDAMRAAFIRRFDEDLPRTETLMAVAHVGYRMALRDLAQVGRNPEGGDPQGLRAEHEHAVGQSPMRPSSSPNTRTTPQGDQT